MRIRLGTLNFMQLGALQGMSRIYQTCSLFGRNMVQFEIF